MYSTSYDKKLCKAGVLHIGYGAFHKAHQAVYFDDYMEKTKDLSWGIIALNLKKEMIQFNNEYILKIGNRSRKVRSHLQFFNYIDNKEYMDKILLHEDIKVVTITVTEGGYEKNSILFKYLTTALSYSKSPLTIISCDNIINNGELLKNGIKNNLPHVYFPSSTVDRITPKPEDVLCTEEYCQWAIDNKHAANFPKLSSVGVILTNKLYTYEIIKLRMLNANHTLFVYFGLLDGYKYFDEVMSAYKSCMIVLNTTEIIPTITCDIDINLYDHLETITKRFENKENKDCLLRIGSEGYTKFKVFVVPIIEDCLRLHITPIHIYKSIRTWFNYSKTKEYIHMDSKYSQINRKFDDFVKDQNLFGTLVQNERFVENMKFTVS